MVKRYAIFIIFLTLESLRLSASPQVPDYIIFKGDTIPTYNLILERYLQNQKKVDQGKLFGLSFRDGATSTCWRGYQAIYRIDNDSLFLVAIVNCGDRSVDTFASVAQMKAIFNNKVIHNKVYINWFSGDINFPLNNKELRWDGVFYAIYEKERVISISKGKVLTIQDVENYVDDPERINRKDRSKIQEVLFEELKKVVWKNDESFDCSDEYLVTIDKNGLVSKVRMTYSDEEIDTYFEKEEYNNCINKLFNALKSLKFDIIKDKGKPIAEDIYIDMWIEKNGKIENRTR